jgi:hypothetical protein
MSKIPLGIQSMFPQIYIKIKIPLGSLIQKFNHTSIPTSFLIKVPKTASSTNVAGKSGYPYARNWN